MIPYKGSLFNFGILFRVHGSALYKALLPSFISTSFYLTLYYLYPDAEDLDLVEDRTLSHPYVVAALVSAFTFLLTFRANFGYNRYWEGATAVHQMHSKWLDLGMELAAFHYQSDQYKNIRPPSFGEHQHLSSVSRHRVRETKPSLRQIEEELGDVDDRHKGLVSFFINLGKKKQSQIPTRSYEHRSINLVSKVSQEELKKSEKHEKARGHKRVATFEGVVDCDFTMLSSKSNPKLDGGIDAPPSLFLQEASHLISLLSAVALSTLRSDMETAESPLIPHERNKPWPPVDPDETPRDIRREFSQIQTSSFERNILFLTGVDRDPKNRTLYNAQRPMRVLGGVSESEIKMLQVARGPLAKVGLCTLWLQEFISREYMNGSTGNVAPPIISRLFQFCSDGMVGYNQARKVAYIPFPFVHSQISALFTVVLLPLIPLLMLTYVDSVWIAACLNFLTILCFCGLHEVARELEDPFKNEPNDLPLVTLQSQFNEALVIMYAGFHPEGWWEASEVSQTP